MSWLDWIEKIVSFFVLQTFFFGLYWIKDTLQNSFWMIVAFPSGNSCQVNFAEVPQNLEVFDF